MRKSDIDAVFTALSKNNPNPETELKFTNNFTMLVAVILSAQSTDAQVNKATKSLFEKISTPQQLLDLGRAGLLEHIKSIGLFNSKADNILKTSKMLIENYDSIVPDKFEELLKLPGVGRKTANVMMDCAFGKPAIAVDTHVFRVSRRLGLASGSTVEKVEAELTKKISKKWLSAGAHHWLVLHGRYICKARKPQCTKCDLTAYCKFFKAGVL